MNTLKLVKQKLTNLKSELEKWDSVVPTRGKHIIGAGMSYLKLETKIKLLKDLIKVLEGKKTKTDFLEEE